MWDLLIAFLILYSAIVTPYDIAFSDSSKVSWFDILIDILLGIDIVLTFFSAYTDDEENLVKNHKKIINNLGLLLILFQFYLLVIFLIQVANIQVLLKFLNYPNYIDL